MILVMKIIYFVKGMNYVLLLVKYLLFIYNCLKELYVKLFLYFDVFL